MAIIRQPDLFSWERVDAASDLDRLRMLLEALPDEDLMRTLEAERKGRRDDYPLRALWNTVLTGIVFQHEGIESLREDGTAWEKTQRWFGYKLRLVVDADYELPLGYAVTKASAGDSPHLLPLMESLQERHPELVERSEYLSADKAYDSQQNNQDLWDDYAIRPLIDIRATWQEEPERPRALYPGRVDTIFHTEQGEVLCRCRDGAPTERDNYAPMAYEGFEQERMTLKYRCPAKAHAIACTQQDLCNEGRQPAHGRIARVPLDTNRRIFTPLARDSKAWTREYKHRTAVERVNSRLDVSFGFERHYIRGMNKMKARAGLALLVMLGMALGWIRAGQRERIRSLVGRPRAA